MEFKIGDDVVHPNYGVGHVIRLEERDFAASGLRWYYVLAIGATTVWLPIQADGTTALRPVTRPQDLDRYRAILRSRPTMLDRDYKKRQLAIVERLTDTSFQMLCEIVRDLTALGWNRPTGETDAILLRKTREKLWSEWAVAAGQTDQETIREVGALLQAGQAAYEVQVMPASH